MVAHHVYYVKVKDCLTQSDAETDGDGMVVVVEVKAGELLLFFCPLLLLWTVPLSPSPVNPTHLRLKEQLDVFSPAACLAVCFQCRNHQMGVSGRRESEREREAGRGRACWVGGQPYGEFLYTPSASG